MNYKESVEWLSSLRRFGIKLGLERFREMTNIVGNPQERFASVHVAGTNGKGSTSAMTACALQKAGYSTGLFVSPFVFDLRERVQVNGEMIPVSDFADLCSEVRCVVEKVEKTPFGQATEFEAKTLLGFLYFAQRNVDFAVVEVGLGGRLDSTNIINPKVCIITSISYDHMDRLGNTLAEIAFEKAGIIKPGVPLITAVTEPEALTVIKERCRQSGSQLISANSANLPLDKIQPGLHGAFQMQNAACAAAALIELRNQGYSIADEHIRYGIENAWLPGRLQTLCEKPLVIADGAHNPASARVVAEYLRDEVGNRPVALVIGMMQSHEPDELLSELLPVADYIITSSPPDSGARSAESLAEAASVSFPGVIVEPDVNLAIQKAIELVGKCGVVCVTGSFYLVGAIDLSIFV